MSAAVNNFGFRLVGCIGGVVGASSYVATSQALDLITVIILNGLMGGMNLLA